MDVRCKKSRAAVPKGRLRPKRPGLAWAAGLLTVALAAIVALGATSARAANGYEWEADTPTSGNYEHILGKPEDGGRYAGRVWTDKSVVHEEGSDVFKTTFSALGSSRVVNSEIQNPLDVVFIVDVSGSMNDADTTNGPRRMAAATDALNNAIGQLMDANQYNRVAVRTFSSTGSYNGTSFAPNNQTLLPLGRYTSRDGSTISKDKAAFSYEYRSGNSGYNSRFSVSASNSESNRTVTGRVNVGGGTNTQNGFRTGMDILASSDSTSVTVDGRNLQRIPAVVLLSDGQPTYSMATTADANRGNWWSSTNEVGPGNGSYYGNGMLALMQASYQKQLVNAHYGVEAGADTAAQVMTIRVGRFSDADALNLADVTLAPNKYFSRDTLLNSSNEMASNIWNAWGSYRSNGSVSGVAVGENNSVYLTRPTENQIDSLVYNDGAYSTDKPEELTDIFTDIIQRLQSTASSPVRDEIGDTDTELTYTDPLGRFMEVSGDTMKLSLFGNNYDVTKETNSDGSYRWVVPHVEIDRGIYGETLWLDQNVTVELARKPDGEVKDAYRETLTVKVSADMLPVRLETVDLNADGTVKKYTPATDVSPLTLTYNVGFSKAITKKGSGAVDLSKVPASYKNAHGDGKGGVNFYSNDYNFAQTPDDGETVGMATASFAPARNNRFYYFQQNRIIYSEGEEGDPTEVPGDDGVIGSASEPVTDRNILVKNPTRNFYLIIDYYSPDSDQMVKLVVARTGEELQSSVDMVDGCVQTVPGTPRLGNTDHFTLKKNMEEGQDNNKSGTASLAFAPTFNYQLGSDSEYVVDIALGNNGRVTVPETAVRIQKDVPAVDGIVVPSQEFSFTVTVDDGRTRTDTLPVYERQGDGWVQKGTQDVAWVEGRATVKLKAGQSVLVEMAPGVAWSAVEEDPSSVEGKQTGFAFEKVDGPVGTTGDGANRSIAGTSVENTVQDVTFTNVYTPEPVSLSIPASKVLEGRDWTADDAFTLKIEPVDGAPMADKDGKHIASEVTVNKDKHSAEFGAISFDKVGTYSYKVTEENGGLGGITYDPTSYTVTVEVAHDAENRKLTATATFTKGEDESAEPVDGIVFTNTYSVQPATTPVTSQVKVSKELSGRKLGEGEFEFKLYDSEGNELATGKNAADGTVTFDRDLTFSAAGEYTYTVREVKGNLGGVAYDETVYSIVLTVTDNGDGTLSVSRKEGTPESVTFKNTYESTGSMDGVASVNVSKVLTGRPLADGQFTFLVSPDDDDSSAKLPETSLTNEAAAAGKPAAAVSPSGKALSELFSAIKFDQNDAGKTFSWTVAEKDADSAPEGYKLDSSTHKVEVKVTDDGAGKITAVTSVDGTEATSGSAEVRFTNAYEAKSDPDAAEGSGRLTAKKELTGRRLSEGEFTFVMSDVKGNEVTTVTNKADGTVDFGAVQYTSAKALGDVANGIATMTTNEDGNPVYRYTYTLSEDESKLPELVTPSVSSIVVSVDVTDNGDGTMTCDVTWPESGSTFKNAYRAEDISLSITGAKVFSVPDGLDGVAAESLTGKFSFTLSDQDGNELHTATNDASGQVAFPAITYTQDSLGGAKERTFTYTVTETGSVPGITNDGEAKTVTVTLSQNDDGSLSARVGGEGPAFTFTNSYGVEELVSSVTDQISVKKTLGGRPMTEGEFNFKLVNAATGETVATGTNAADGTVELSPITYTEPGTYTYVLSEVAGDAPSVSYDDSEVTVTTTVTDKGDGRLEAKHVVDGGSVTFENIYSPKAAHATLSVSKQLTGRDFLEGETFSFTLAAQDGAPMPAAGGETATVSENLQQAKFGAITFTKPGEYRYTISEVGGGSTKDGVAYDGSTFTAVVTVKDDTRTGRLEATVAYQNADGAAVSIPSFINRYTSTGSMDGVVSVNVSKVLTGRPMAAGQFAFSVTPVDGASSAKLPAQTLTNQASDTSGTPAAVVTAEGETLSKLFSGVTFTEADAGKTFAWTVAETSAAAPGYTVDQHTHTVEVKVADNGNGTITATTYVNGDAVTGSHALIAFKNGYHAESNPDAAEGSGRVTTTKTLHNRDLAGGEFTFQMRDAKDAVVATVTNAADGTVDFGAVKYTSEQALADVASGVATQVGTADKPVYRYTYTLSEVTDALPENVSAEVPTVTVSVDVADNGDGTMTCSVVWPSDGASTGFVNAYEADPLPVTISGTKVFTAPEGLSVPESVYGAFTFTLTDEAGNVLGTATNDRSGSVAFPEITYTQDDLAGGTERTFTYTVTETGSVPGITNDAAPTRTVTVHLSQGKDGHLSTRVEDLPFTFTNTYSVEAIATSVTDQVKVTKTLTGRTLADGEFEFQLVGEDGEVAASGTNAADGTVTLSPVTYTEPGTYTYTLSEVQGDKPGVGYDDAVYTVTTTVVDDGDGTLSATHEVTGGEAVFNNTFTPSSVVDPDFGIPARKILVGRDWRDDDAFNFVVTAETENAPMPDPSAVFATAGSPMVNFGAVAFSEPGEYSYLVSEVAGDEEGMTYSQAVYRVCYEVTTDPVTGELQLDVHIHRIRDDAGADAADEWPFDVPLEFVNTYEAPEEPVVPEEPGTPEQPAGPVEKLPEPVKAVVLPITGLIAKTGDVVAPLLPWIGAGAAVVTAGVLRILKGGRRRED